MRDGADDSVQDRVQVTIILELGSAAGADLDGDDQGQRAASQPPRQGEEPSTRSG